ncbi:MAG: hypothetical protein SFY69_13215 [Planctomycetota bacterium]|nr:hypothetical protein [Planctomycetota bacterium]
MHRDGESVCFEALETRLALTGEGFKFESVYPEGYVSANVNEYVPITNYNDQDASWELLARYESGERDQVIASGVLPANARGGVTISDILFPEQVLVRTDVPFALILRSTLPLAATSSHYDFGSSLGESFTAARDTFWTFSDGQKDPFIRDYFLVYNPQETTTTATLTLYYEDGSTYTNTKLVEGLRRSGWSIADLPAPTGAFSASITANAEVVAAHSHYDLRQGRGYGEIGSPGGGTLAGAIGSIDYDGNFYEVNGDDAGGARFEAQSYVTILNTGNTDASVTLYFILDEAGDPPPVTRTINAEPGRTTFRVDDLDLQIGDEIGLVFESDRPVTVGGSVYQGRDATGQVATSVAATDWVFGEGYMDRTFAGSGLLENLYIFNPDDTSVEATIEIFFSEGTTVTLVRGVDDREFEDVVINNLDEIINRPNATNWYGFRVTAPAPIVVTFEHWDGGLGGGFQTPFMPVNGIVPLSDVLTL